jgi:AraC family transcriptional regulator, arabinose operon regulatory protein
MPLIGIHSHNPPDNHMSKMTNPKAARKHRTIGPAKPQGDSRIVHGLLAAGAGVLPQKRDWIHHRFQFFALGWVLSGRGTYQVDNGPIQPVYPGSVFTVYPGPLFHYGPKDPASITPPTWEECFLVLRGPAIKHLIKHHLFFTDDKVHTAPPPPSLVPRWRQMVDLTRSPNPHDHDQALLMALGFLLEVQHARNLARHPHLIDPLVDAAKSRLAALHHSDIHLPALAAHLGVSYSTLRQKFAAATGHGPARYLAQLRCQNAQKLLADTDTPIKQIAAQIGIPDPFSFSRTFKRITGTSPENYRRQSRPFSPAPSPSGRGLG